MTGSDGDFYIDIDAWDIYGPKAGGVWPAGVSLIGPAGAAGTPGADGTDGNTILSGTVAPTIEGVDGDYYLDTVTSRLYGPKTGGIWTGWISVTGATGPPGASGSGGSTADPWAGRPELRAWHAAVANEAAAGAKLLIVTDSIGTYNASDPETTSWGALLDKYLLESIGYNKAAGWIPVRELAPGGETPPADDMHLNPGVPYPDGLSWDRVGGTAGPVGNGGTNTPSNTGPGGWGTNLASGEYCEVTRPGDGIIIHYTKRNSAETSPGSGIPAIDRKLSVFINGVEMTPVGGVQTSAVGIATAQSGHYLSYANPDGYGPMLIRVEGGASTPGYKASLDGVFICDGNRQSGIRTVRSNHEGWGFTDYINYGTNVSLWDYILNRQPDLILTCLGINDFFIHGVTDPADMATLLSNWFISLRGQYTDPAKVSLAYAFPVHTIFTPDLAGPTRRWDVEFKDALRATCEANNVLWLDFDDAVGEYTDLVAGDPLGIATYAGGDGIHPGDKGHSMMAQPVFDALKPVGRTLDIPLATYSTPLERSMFLISDPVTPVPTGVAVTSRGDITTSGNLVRPYRDLGFSVYLDHTITTPDTTWLPAQDRVAEVWAGGPLGIFNLSGIIRFGHANVSHQSQGVGFQNTLRYRNEAGIGGALFGPQFGFINQQHFEADGQRVSWHNEIDTTMAFVSGFWDGPVMANYSDGLIDGRQLAYSSFESAAFVGTGSLVDARFGLWVHDPGSPRNVSTVTKAISALGGFTGSGQIHVKRARGFALANASTPQYVYMEASNGWAVVAYTVVSGRTLTNCTLISGSGSVAVGKKVALTRTARTSVAVEVDLSTLVGGQTIEVLLDSADKFVSPAAVAAAFSEPLERRKLTIMSSRVTLADTSISAGSMILTSASADFTQDDVGLGISVPGLNPYTVIDRFINNSTVHVSISATSNVTNQVMTIINGNGPCIVSYGACSGNTFTDCALESGSGILRVGATVSPYGIINDNVGVQINPLFAGEENTAIRYGNTKDDYTFKLTDTLVRLNPTKDFYIDTPRTPGDVGFWANVDFTIKEQDNLLSPRYPGNYKPVYWMGDTGSYGPGALFQAQGRILFEASAGLAGSGVAFQNMLAYSSGTTTSGAMLTTTWGYINAPSMSAGGTGNYTYYRKEIDYDYVTVAGYWDTTVFNLGGASVLDGLIDPLHYASYESSVNALDGASIYRRYGFWVHEFNRLTESTVDLSGAGGIIDPVTYLDGTNDLILAVNGHLKDFGLSGQASKLACIQTSTGGWATFSYTAANLTTGELSNCLFVGGSTDLVVTGATVVGGRGSYSTTIAPASDGVAISSFAGAGVIEVESTDKWLSEGKATIITAQGRTALVSYTGVTPTSLTGVTKIAFNPGDTLATGGVISNSGIIQEQVGLEITRLQSGVQNTAIRYGAVKPEYDVDDYLFKVSGHGGIGQRLTSPTLGLALVQDGIGVAPAWLTTRYRGTEGAMTPAGAGDMLFRILTRSWHSAFGPTPEGFSAMPTVLAAIAAQNPTPTKQGTYISMSGITYNSPTTREFLRLGDVQAGLVLHAEESVGGQGYGNLSFHAHKGASVTGTPGQTTGIDTLGMIGWKGWRVIGGVGSWTEDVARIGAGNLGSYTSTSAGSFLTFAVTQGGTLPDESITSFIIQHDAAGGPFEHAYGRISGLRLGPPDASGLPLGTPTANLTNAGTTAYPSEAGSAVPTVPISVTSSFLQLNPGLAVDMTGTTPMIEAGTDGQTVVIQNISAFNITFTDGVGSGTLFGGTIILEPYQAMSLIYDASNAAWVTAGATGAAGGLSGDPFDSIAVQFGGVTVHPRALDRFRGEIVPRYTELSAAIDGSTTSIPVSYAAFSRVGVKEVIRVEDEQMLILSGQGTSTLTVLRGVNQTTAVAHPQYATVLTDAVRNIIHVGDSISSGDVGTQQGWVDAYRRDLGRRLGPSLGDGFQGTWRNRWTFTQRNSAATAPMNGKSVLVPADIATFYADTTGWPTSGQFVVETNDGQATIAYTSLGLLGASFLGCTIVPFSLYGSGILSTNDPLYMLYQPTLPVAANTWDIGPWLETCRFDAGENYVGIWKRPTDVVVGQIDVYWVDVGIASTGGWSWSIDGGTTWYNNPDPTRITLGSAPVLRKTVIPASYFASTTPRDFRIRASNSTGSTDQEFYLVGLDIWSTPPTFGVTEGIKVHNMAYSGHTLNAFVRHTGYAGDWGRIFDGDPASIVPDLVVIGTLSNDAVLNYSIPLWEENLDEIQNRVTPYADTIYVNVFEQGGNRALPDGQPAWSNLTTYALGDMVTYGSYTYTSKVNGNLGNTPPASAYVASAFWTLGITTGMQANVRASTKAKALAYGSVVMDIYDGWSAEGLIGFDACDTLGGTVAAGDGYYVDYLHPSALGHRNMASRLSRLLTMF